MSYNNFSVAINLTTATRKNIIDVHKALKDIKKLDDQIDFSSFAAGVGKINWDEVLKGSELEDMANNLEDLLRMVEGLERAIEAKQAVLGPDALDELKNEIVENFKNYGASIKGHITMRVNEMVKGIKEDLAELLDKYGRDWLEKQDALWVENLDKKFTDWMEEHVWNFEDLIADLNGKYYELVTHFEGFPNLYRKILDEYLNKKSIADEELGEEPLVRIQNLLTQNLPALLRNILDLLSRKIEASQEDDVEGMELLKRIWGGVTSLHDYLSRIQGNIIGRIDVMSTVLGKALEIWTGEEMEEDMEERVRQGTIFHTGTVGEVIEDIEEAGEDMEDLKNAFQFYNEKLKKEMVEEVKENRNFLMKIDKFLESLEDDEKQIVEDAVIENGDDEE